MTENCAFCDRKNFESRIIKETPNWYVVATLGQITDGGYVLVIPKRHIACMGDVHDEVSLGLIVSEMCRMIARTFVAEDALPQNSVMMFEHGIVGQSVCHAHLHLFPAQLSLTNEIRERFPESEIEKLPRGVSVQQRYRERKEPYLFWTMLGGDAMVCWNPPAPMQYLRTLVATLLGRPERANWRTMDPMLDRTLWSGTVARMKASPL